MPIPYDENAVRRSQSENAANPEQIIFQFAAQVPDVFLSFKMPEEPVEDKELRFAAGTGRPMQPR